VIAVKSEVVQSPLLLQFHAGTRPSEVVLDEVSAIRDAFNLSPPEGAEALDFLHGGITGGLMSLLVERVVSVRRKRPISNSVTRFPMPAARASVRTSLHHATVLAPTTLVPSAPHARSRLLPALWSCSSVSSPSVPNCGEVHRALQDVQATTFLEWPMASKAASAEHSGQRGNTAVIWLRVRSALSDILLPRPPGGCCRTRSQTSSVLPTPPNNE